MNVSFIADKFDVNAIVKRPEHGNITNYIIFDHTDNKQARESIEKSLLLNRKNVIIISTGNEEDYGQVFVSNTISSISSSYLSSMDITNRRRELLRQFSIVSSVISSPHAGKVYTINFLPSLLEVYKDFKDTEKPSCTDITLIDDQSMPINSLVAQLAYNAFYMIIAGKPLNYNMARCNINNTYSTNYITHPFDLRDLFCKALLGDSSAEAIEFLNKLNLSSKPKQETFTDEKYIKYAIMIIDLLENYGFLDQKTKEALIQYSAGEINANI